MTDYNVKFTDTNKTPLVVQQDTQSDTGTDLLLFGRSFLEYGEQLNENLVRLLENFACPEAAGSDPATPDLDQANDTLSEPVEGQLWFNTTRSAIFQYDGTQWNKLTSGADYAANWGQISHGQQLPQPVSSSGYVFPYSECIWIVSPAGHTGRFDYMVCTTDASAVVDVQYRLLGNNTLTNGLANYLIIGIAGNSNADVASYSAVPLPGITPTPTPSVGASASVTPTGTPPPSPSHSLPPTPTPSKTRAPAASPTRTPTPTPTKTPTPTPSAIPPLTVQIVDSARGGSYTDSISLCDLAEYASVRDYGNIGCSTSFGMCASGQCAPEPGTFAGGDTAVGAEMGITVSGGVAPYTVRVKNFTVSSGGAGFTSSGDCAFFGGSAGFALPNTGTVYTFSINTNGGSVNSLAMKASCGSGIYSVSGNFTVEVTDARGTIRSSTFPYTLQRTNTSGGGGIGGGGGGGTNTDTGGMGGV